MKRRKKIKNMFIHITLVLIFLVILFPVLVMLSTSLETYRGAISWPPTWIPEIPQWQNYAAVWGGRYEFESPFINSVFISVITALITLLFAFPAAYAISRFTFFGSKSLLFIVLMTQMFSPIVLIIGLYEQIQLYNLMNTLTGIILTNCAFTIPLSVWLLHGFMKSIPYELEQAAAIDGCSRIKGIFRVVIPLSGPGIAMTSIYSYIWSWNDLLIPLVFTSDPSKRTVSLALTDFAGQSTTYWHEMMAAGIITTIPIAIMFSFVQKYFVEGFTAGSIKG